MNKNITSPLKNDSEPYNYRHINEVVQQLNIINLDLEVIKSDLKDLNSLNK